MDKSQEMIPLSVRVTPEIRKEIERLAAQERRSLSTMTALLVERGIESTTAPRIP